MNQIWAGSLSKALVSFSVVLNCIRQHLVSRFSLIYHFLFYMIMLIACCP